MTITVYHGGNTTDFVPPLFVAEQYRVALSYAKDRGGKVYSFDFNPRNMATELDIHRAAEALGVYDDSSNTYEFVSPNVSNDAPKIIEYLAAQGFDCATFFDFAMDSDFDMFEVICIFDLSTLGEPTLVDNQL